MKTPSKKISIKIFCFIFSIIFVFVPQVNMSTQAQDNDKSTDFITSKINIDELLRRPYDGNVVTGYSDGLFALHSNGWGFDNNSVFRTGLSAGYGMKTDVLIDGAATIPTSGEFMPSHITRTYRADELSFMKNNLATSATVTASFTSKYDTLSQVNDGIVSFNDAPRSRWSNYSSPIREGEDYLEFTFGSNRLVNGMNIYLFTDNSACALPEKITVKYKNNGEWVDCNISNTTAPIVSGKNTMLFSTVNTNAVRIYFKAKAQKCVAVTELEISEGGSDRSNLAISATAKASYTSSYDSLAHINDGVISYNDSPRNRWSNYISGGRNAKDYIDFDLGVKSSVNQVSVYVYNDGGACVPPQSITLYYYDSGWKKIGDITSISAGKNTFDFNAVSTNMIRVEFTPQSGKSVSATEIEILGANSATDISRGIIITENKFVTHDDVLVSIIKAQNNGAEDTVITVNSKSSLGKNSSHHNGKFISLAGKGFDDYSNIISKAETLKSGETKEFILAMAFSDSESENKAKQSHVFDSEDILREHTDEFLDWFYENVPFFDCSDLTLLQTYYFRWYTYRNHIRLTKDGNYVISEFLPNVGWAGTDNTISCAANHHFYEGRWIKNQNYLNDYQDFWVSSNAQPRLYSFPMADSYYSRYLVSGMKNQVTRYTNKLIENYNGWVSSKYNSSTGLFHQLCDRDGMEYSLGGDGYRPTINSYMFADAMAISKISSLIGNSSNSNLFRSKATTIKNAVQQKLWNGDEQFFETVNTSTNKSVNIREQMGYVPWCYNLPDDSAKYSVAFSQLLDNNGFNAPFGPTTAERRDPNFMKQDIAHNCLWNGPSWPFATSQTLTAAANLLNNYSNNNYFTKNNYFNLLKTYANSHYKDGYSWIAEDLDPITGKWIVDFPRSVNYNHSTFNDLIITGLAGFRPSESTDTLTVNPLITDSNLSYFVLENILYKGRNITIVYDKDGSRYNSGKGLSVYVDGVLKANSDKIQKLEVKFDGHSYESGVCTKCGEAHPSLSQGDVNGDSKINLVDLLCLKRRIANNDTNTLCDTNTDSSVNTDDLVRMKKILLGDI